MDAPPPAREAPGRPDGFPHGSWWFEPSLTVLPSEELVLLEWTPEATFQFLPASGEVQAWLQGEQQQGQQGGAERAGGHGQGGPYEAGGTQQRRRQQQQQGGGGGGSCLCSERQGRFVRYVGVEEGAGKEGVVVRERLFAAEAVPEHVWVGLAAAAAGEGDGAPRLPRRLPLAKYSAHALKLRCGLATGASGDCPRRRKLGGRRAFSHSCGARACLGAAGSSCATWWRGSGGRTRRAAAHPTRCRAPGRRSLAPKVKARGTTWRRPSTRNPTRCGG